MQKYITLKPKGDVNCAEVRVYHSKGYKQVVLNVQPGKSDGHFFSYMCFTNKQFTVAEMLRFNQKKFDAVCAEVAEQMEQRDGPTWELIMIHPN